MKIISKFKDFYDHKVAKYGVDPVLVFDRRLPSGAEILHSLPKPPAEWEKEYGIRCVRRGVGTVYRQPACIPVCHE